MWPFILFGNKRPRHHRGEAMAPAPNSPEPKEEPTAIRVISYRITIPSEYQLEICALLDEWHQAKKTGVGECVAGARMWLRIEEILPETKVGSWRINSDKAFIRIEKIFKED